ncbi:MAG: hypothetical protein QOF36_1579, partial [Microbacteriaceae bacterium]|nr:hypothetical protein [Microbacteriaceae bacterium]
GKLSLAPVLADDADTHGRDVSSEGPADPAEGADVLSSVE